MEVSMRISQNRLVALITALALVLIVGETGRCASPAPETEAAAKAVNAFAVDLYKQLPKPDGNLIFSPYSVSISLGMAYAGARGRTESQMAKALHLSLPQGQMNKALGALNAQILETGKNKAVEINIANALWAEKSFPILESYLKTIQADYQGGIKQLDFLHGPDAARKTINTWVEEQTKQKIKDLLEPAMVGADTRLLLTNAIYFKGSWQSPFRKQLTKEDNFTLLDGSKAPVPMMNQEAWFRYLKQPDLQALEMPYKGGELSMIVLLPSKGRNFENFEQSITLEKLNQWIGKLKEQETNVMFGREVNVFLPKFKISSELLLKEPVASLGMTDAFSPRDADFSGMTGRKDLFISQGVHKAFVETNEEGTEAAAATGWALQYSGTVAYHNPEFRADHPFVFLILHKPSNCILFFGRVTKP
jgi:serpin B